MAMFSGIAAVADRQSLIEFWFRVQHFLRVRARISRGAGLHAREYETLLAVKTVPIGQCANVALIAKRLCLQQSPSSALVKSLVNKGLLRADRNPHDGRSLALKLTPRGAKLLRAIAAQSVNGLQAEGPELCSALRKTIRRKDHCAVTSQSKQAEHPCE